MTTPAGSGGEIKKAKGPTRRKRFPHYLFEVSTYVERAIRYIFTFLGRIDRGNNLANIQC